MLILEKYEFAGWENCLHLTNGLIDSIITTDVGPRIIHLGFKGQQNLFYQNAKMNGKRGGKEWVNYGGHRLWHAPEYPPRTYCPDNESVLLEEHHGFIRMIQPIENTCGIQKELDIAMHESKAQIKITHRLRNHNVWDVELAPWAVSVMAPSGIAILPLPKRGLHEDHLTPLNSLALWAYTDMSDPPLEMGNGVHFSEAGFYPAQPAKNWCAFAGWVGSLWNGGSLFIKTISYDPVAVYPDLGCNIELFTDPEILEVETLGPLSHVRPQQAVEHTETWYLAKDIVLPDSEQGLHDTIQSVFQSTW